MLAITTAKQDTEPVNEDNTLGMLDAILVWISRLLKTGKRG
jgi:hypothetical protein